MSNAPAFQFYAHDFLAGRVATYSLDEIGAYSLLLAFDWSLNGLPLEPERLAKLCRVSRRKFVGIWEVIGEQFPIDGERRRNPRLKLEREKQEANRAKKKSAAETRWNADAFDMHIQNECPPTPTPSPIAVQPQPARKRSRHFPVDPTPDELSVLEHYTASHPKRRWGPKDVRAVRGALKLGFTTQDCAAAIDGNALDPWHRERHKHELPYVLRDAGMIDGFREKAEKRQRPVDWSRFIKDGWMTDELERLTRPAGVLSA